MVDTAWATSDLSFAGWVPNVGSHLSFSLIGSRAGGGVSRFSLRVRKPGRIARLVCAFQKRVIDDFLLPPSIVKFCYPDIEHHWLLLGETETIEVAQAVDCATDGVENATVQTAPDEQGVLIGTIYAVPYEEDGDERKAQKAALAAIRARIDQAVRRGDGEAAIADIRERILAASDGVRAVRYALMRTGEVRVWFDERLEGFDDDQHEHFARQAYFFIKDMTHRHVHHHPSEDQITPLVRFETDDSETRRRCEIGWRRETVWNLTRFSEKRMGNSRLNEMREAVGMLAYADAFQKSLLDHVRDPDDPLKYIPNSSVYGYDFAHIRASTQVRIDQTAATRTATGQLLIAIFAGALASLSLLTGLVTAFNMRLRDAKAPNLVDIELTEWLLRWGAAHPISTVTISGMILYTIFALFLSDVLFNKPNRPAQGLRGLMLSQAIRLRLSSRRAHQLLIAAYVVVFALGFLLAWGGISYVTSGQAAAHVTMIWDGFVAFAQGIGPALAKFFGCGCVSAAAS